MAAGSRVGELIDECRAAFLKGPVADGYPVHELRPPADPTHIEAAERELGVSFPQELIDLFAHADGGDILPAAPSFTTVGPNSFSESVMVSESKYWRDNFRQGWFHTVEQDPGSDFVLLAGGGQFGLLIQTAGEHAGTVLYFNVVEPGIIKAAPSITNLLLAYRDMAAIAEPFAKLAQLAPINERYQIDPRTL